MDEKQGEEGNVAPVAPVAPVASEAPGATAKPAEQSKRSPWVKLAIEVGPLIVFFVANAKAGIFVATGAFMAAIVTSLTANWIIEKRLPPMALFTGVFVLFFGGLTIYLDDEVFIMLKPTVVNGLFAVILTGGLMVGKLLLRHAFGEAMELTEQGWRALTVRWIFFFIFLALLNEVVRRNWPDSWVTFKVFGIMPLTILFTITLMPLIQRHQLAPAPADD